MTYSDGVIILIILWASLMLGCAVCAFDELRDRTQRAARRAGR